MKRLSILICLPLISGCHSLPSLVKAFGKSAGAATNACTLEIHSLMYGDIRFTWNAIPWATGQGSSFFNNATAGGAAMMLLPDNTAVMRTPDGGVLLKQKGK